MSDIKIRQEKMQEKRKQTPFREFLKEIASLRALWFYRNRGHTSVYPDTDRIKWVVSHAEFEAKRDELTKHGIDYDFSKDFFENFKRLYDQTPFPALYNYTWAENCDYVFSAYMSKNCYLSFTIITNCANVMYSFAVTENCTNVLNSSQVWNNSVTVYMSLGVINSMNVFYSRYINNSSDLWFCTNMVGCHNCIMCDSLENKSYYIKSQEYSPEEYKQKAKELLDQRKLYPDFFAQLSYEWKNFGSTDVTGKFVLKSQDVEDGLYSLEIKDGKNLLMVGGSHLNEHMYDVFEAGAHGNTDFWWAINAGVKSENVYNSEWIATCNSVYYSRFLEHCNYCIGCIWLKNKQFCILNKQYSQEERFELANKIFAQMEKDWILWKYFPATMNPFYFNDTVASLVDDFDKEDIKKEWYLRRDEEIKTDIPENAEVIHSCHPEWSEGYEWTKIYSSMPQNDNNKKYLSDYQWLEDGEWKINPEILKTSKKRKIGDEGCLSIPLKYGSKVQRYEKVTMRYYDENGNLKERGASGFLSRVFQHEIDHLNGILYTDEALEVIDVDDDLKPLRPQE